MRDRLFAEDGEADERLWCCAIPLDRAVGGAMLSLSVIVFGEPDRAQRGRIHRALRYEAGRP